MERMLFSIGRLLTKPHMYFENVPNSFLISMNLAALLIAAFIFSEFLTMPLFCINRSKSFLVNPATLAGSKPANASLKFFLLFNMVLQQNPPGSFPGIKIKIFFYHYAMAHPILYHGI